MVSGQTIGGSMGPGLSKINQVNNGEIGTIDWINGLSAKCNLR